MPFITGQKQITVSSSSCVCQSTSVLSLLNSLNLAVVMMIPHQQIIHGVSEVNETFEMKKDLHCFKCLLRHCPQKFTIQNQKAR